MESDSISFRKLEISDMSFAMDILNQEPFRTHDNTGTKKTDENWLTKLIENGFSFALTLDEQIVGVIFSESIIDNGVLLALSPLLYPF